MRVARGHYGAEEVVDLPEPSSSVDPVDPVLAQRLFDLEQRRRGAIRSSFCRFDCLAMGISVGLVLGGAVFAATAVGVLEGDALFARTIGSLRSFFPGYSVTWQGAAVGAGYAMGIGLAVGALTAWFRNLGMRLVLKRALWQASRFRRRHLLDEV